MSIQEFDSGPTSNDLLERHVAENASATPDRRIGCASAGLRLRLRFLPPHRLPFFEKRRDAFAEIRCLPG